MRIDFPGAHNCESETTRMNCILIDKIFALDAGGLTSSLSFADQLKLKAVFLTHPHYDHIRDIPALGMSLFLNEASVKIYGSEAVYETLNNHLLNGDVYAKFMERPAGNPALKFVPFNSFETKDIEGYKVTALQVNHPVPAAGYHIESADGKTVFYTGDTGSGLAECWKYISPRLLITELTAPNRYEESVGKGAKHLTPRLLQAELTAFRDAKGYVPQVILVHMNPMTEAEIKSEIDLVARAMNASITLAYEGMSLNL